MAYLYAAMGVMMLTGIMAVFEMGMSLTGQSLLPNVPNEYLSKDNENMREKDRVLLKGMSQSGFDEKVLEKGLCDALKDIEAQSWSSINNSGYWEKSCQLSRSNGHRSIVRKDTYQLFSCVLSAGAAKCSFEEQ